MALMPRQRQHSALEKEEEAELQDPCLLLLHGTRAASGAALQSSWQAQLCAWGADCSHGSSKPVSKYSSGGFEPPTDQELSPEPANFRPGNRTASSGWHRAGFFPQKGSLKALAGQGRAQQVPQEVWAGHTPGDGEQGL